MSEALLSEIGTIVAPLRRVDIPKAGQPGNTRPLGIPTCRDRTVMKAAALLLEAIWEADFLPSSFGYRPGRSVHDALGAFRTVANQGIEWVLEGDVSNAFEASSHYLPGSCNLIKETSVGANYVDAQAFSPS